MYGTCAYVKVQKSLYRTDRQTHTHKLIISKHKAHQISVNEATRLKILHSRTYLDSHVQYDFCLLHKVFMLS